MSRLLIFLTASILAAACTLDRPLFLLRFSAGKTSADWAEGTIQHSGLLTQQRSTKAAYLVVRKRGVSHAEPGVAACLPPRPAQLLHLLELLQNIPPAVPAEALRLKPAHVIALHLPPHAEKLSPELLIQKVPFVKSWSRSRSVLYEPAVNELESVVIFKTCFTRRCAPAIGSGRRATRKLNPLGVPVNSQRSRSKHNLNKTE